MVLAAAMYSDYEDRIYGTMCQQLAKEHDGFICDKF